MGFFSSKKQKPKKKDKYSSKKGKLPCHARKANGKICNKKFNSPSELMKHASKAHGGRGREL